MSLVLEPRHFQHTVDLYMMGTSTQDKDLRRDGLDEDACIIEKQGVSKQVLVALCMIHDSREHKKSTIEVAGALNPEGKLCPAAMPLTSTSIPFLDSFYVSLFPFSRISGYAIKQADNPWWIQIRYQQV